MLPLHYKLELTKQIVKARDEKSKAFKFLKMFSPKLFEAQVKSGILVYPQNN